MSANDRQEGGSHYGGSEYQHWDWVSDLRLHYLAGNASKYVYRHRKKNGPEDLLKAIHYVDKAKELGIQGCGQTHRQRFFWRFVMENDVHMHDAMILFFIMEGQWLDAGAALTTLYEARKTA
jgi:hypothetical protein